MQKKSNNSNGRGYGIWMLIGLLQVIQDGWEGACQIGGSFLLSTADTVLGSIPAPCHL